MIFLIRQHDRTGCFCVTRILSIAVSVIVRLLSAHSSKTATHHLIRDLVGMCTVDNDRTAVVFGTFIVIER